VIEMFGACLFAGGAFDERWGGEYTARVERVADLKIGHYMKEIGTELEWE
jgi:hypothetical protein